MTAITNDHGQPTIAEPAGQIMVGLHVIALIDLLGQSSELAKWDSVPQSFPPPPEWLQAARNSWGRVLLWREEFEKRFAEFLNSLRKYAEQLAPQHPTEVRRLFDEYRETRIQRLSFPCILCVFMVRKTYREE